MGYVFWDDERMRVWKSIYNHKDGSSYILVPPINGSWWSYQRYWIVFFRSRRHFVSVYIMLFYGFSIRRLLVKRHFCVAFYSPNSLILASVFVVSVDLQIKTYFFYMTCMLLWSITRLFPRKIYRKRWIYELCLDNIVNLLLYVGIAYIDSLLAPHIAYRVFEVK